MSNQSLWTPSVHSAGKNCSEFAFQFVSSLVPNWILHGMPQGSDPAPIAEAFDGAGRVITDRPVTTLTQSRSAFFLAHLYLLTGRQDFLRASKRIHAFQSYALRCEDGGYRYSVTADGQPINTDESRVRRTYDQTFVLLALVTLRKADPDFVSQQEIDDCWSFIEGSLVDRSTGALWEDDHMAIAGAKTDDLRAQNPHMHLLEATLQAYEMSRDVKWLARSEHLVSIAEEYFIDKETGAIREFVGHDLRPVAGSWGQRREPGHQFEWDWLLRRYAGFTGSDMPVNLAHRMRSFGERYGVRKEGVMAGSLFDAVDSSGGEMEPSHLLWPLTEATKTYASLFFESGREPCAKRAHELMGLMFSRFINLENSSWINRVDDEGQVLWDEGLSRLLYHVALAVTEGSRAGLWHLGGDR